ncbi:hypothetical protein [Asticcacaulis solisilvae]|uniref:hypothetical protein n=1 Tax=Asticcacaulis solisilvae TaxID=1217274 RepID=UPI003FD7B4A5
MTMTRMVLMSSCDEGYFPLAKGLFLSLLEAPEALGPEEEGPDIRLAFLDIGCAPSSLDWLRDRGIEVVAGTNDTMGALSSPHLGYHRAQTCRAFLPDLFPDADILGWIDCDTWFQDAGILRTLMAEALKARDSILVSPEVHYTYTKINDQVRVTHKEVHGYYEALYGTELADRLHVMPCVNSGFFVMHRTNALWEAWKAELRTIYGRDFEKHGQVARHFGEQTSLNMLIRTGHKAVYFDPMYNYLCLWNPPFRDADGVVRVSYPPFSPVGMLHLAGGWRYFGRTYAERGLLYRTGDYLEDREKLALLKAFGAAGAGRH